MCNDCEADLCAGRYYNSPDFSIFLNSNFVYDYSKCFYCNEILLFIYLLNKI
jgi:hypothetical protein